MWNKTVSSAIVGSSQLRKRQCPTRPISNTAPFSLTATPIRRWRNGCIPALSASLCADFRAARPRPARFAKGTAADPRYQQALDLIKAGKPREAEPLLRAAAEEEEEAGLTRIKQAAEKWRNLGAIAGYADPKRAREYYAKAAKLDPDNIKGMVWHAYMEQGAGNLAEAERAYGAVLGAGVKGNDNFALYWAGLGLGDVRMMRGELPGALSLYREASSDAEHFAKADPANAGLQRDLSVSYEWAMC
jgi:tetratricopeptide (TPR) repeat protein